MVKSMIIEDSNFYRNTSKLWAPSATVECALKFCIPCIYKLLVTTPIEKDNKKLNPPCHVNIRPELCIREKTNQIKKKKEIKSDRGKEVDCTKSEGASETLTSNKSPLFLGTNHKILIVGDGDFSYSLSIAKEYLNSYSQLICTSYPNKEELLNVYSNVQNNLDELDKNFPNVIVKHGVDANKLDQFFAKDEFSLIIFNFPCIPDDAGKDGQAAQLEANTQLVRNFIVSSSKILGKTDGQILITHKTKEPFSWWKIPTLCQVKTNDDSNVCKFNRNVVFDRSLFQGYNPKKVEDNKSFPVFDAVTHCFGYSLGKNEITIESENVDTLLSIDIIKRFDLIKLNQNRLEQLVSLLQLASQKPVAAHLSRSKRKIIEQKLNNSGKDSKKLRKRRKKAGSKKN